MNLRILIHNYKNKIIYRINYNIIRIQIIFNNSNNKIILKTKGKRKIYIKK